MGTFFGTAGNDRFGNSGSDLVYGLDGNDEIFSGSGVDTIYGGPGNDTILGSTAFVGEGFTGPDDLDGGTGFDTLDYYFQPRLGIRADLRAGTITYAGHPEYGVERIVGIESILASIGWDRIIGDGAANLFKASSGNDTLVGNMGADTLIGDAGVDRLDGGSGGDSISGGQGSDIIAGGTGADVILANEDNDRVDAGAGNDNVRGGTGSDTLSGGGGDDRLVAGVGNDLVHGGTGNDMIVAGGGSDRVDGGAGSDNVTGGFGADVIVGGSGDDRLAGEAGDNIVEGGSGNDLILAGPSDHRLDGGSGTDTLYIVGHQEVFENGDRDVRINLGTGTLRLNGGPRSTVVSIENVSTGSGNDTVIGSEGANLITVGSSNYHVGHGDNFVYARGGDDTVIGGTYYGADLLNGGAGDDLIMGEGSFIVEDFGNEYPGTDTLVGGAGNDTIHGVGAYLLMSGGAGDDLFILRPVDVHEWREDEDVNRDFFPPAVIADFAEGDEIHLEFASWRAVTPTPKFIGEVTEQGVDDMELYEIGYMRSGDDTLVLARLPLTFPDSGPLAFDQKYQQITLTGYQGALTAADFDLA